MICLIMALNTLFCSFFVWMAFKTSGMVMKEYTWPPEKAEQLIEGMYDASTIEVDRSDLTKGPSWRRWPMIYPLTWIRSRGLGLTVGVCKAFKPGTTLILIGPIDEVNKQSAQNLQSIIDVTLMAHDLDYSGQREPVGDTAPSEDDASSQRAMGPTFTNAPKIRI